MTGRIRLQDRDFLSLVQRARAQGLQPSALIRQEEAQLAPLTNDWTKLDLLVPIEAPEVWAAGVTYERSREARNTEVQSKGPVRLVIMIRFTKLNGRKFSLSLLQLVRAALVNTCAFAAIRTGKFRSRNSVWWSMRMVKS